MYLHHRFIFTNQFTYKNGFILDLFNAANHNHNIFLYAERCSIIPLEPLISLIVKKIAPSRIPSIRFRSLEGTTRNREIRERTNQLPRSILRSLRIVRPVVHQRTNSPYKSHGCFMVPRISKKLIKLANLKFDSKVFYKASTYKSNINRDSSLSRNIFH